MTMSIKDMIARCIERMRGGACATCDNRTVCPAGRWQQAFGPPRQQRSNGAAKAACSASSASWSRRFAKPAPATRCFKREVEQAIEPLLGAGEVSIDRVARELGMSRQTLYRRLKAGADDVRGNPRRQAPPAGRALPRLDRSSVKAAAYQLGFSDPAAFSRAFKRWTGTSPSDFRAAPAG